LGISDPDGNIIDPENNSLGWNEDNLTFTAIKWTLLEASLAPIPADAMASIRSLSNRPDIEAIRVRMLSRQRMCQRTSDLQYDEASPTVAMIIARAKKRQQLHDDYQSALAASEDQGD
jgi:hypothetical protein